MRAPHGRGDQQRAGRLVEHREPKRDSRHDRQRCRAGFACRTPRGWRSKRAAALDVFTLRANRTRSGDDDPGPPAVEEMEQKGSCVSGEAGPRDQSIPSGTKWPFISGQLLETWPARKPATQAPSRSWTNKTASVMAPAVSRAGRRRLFVASASQIERGPDQRRHQEQREQQMRGQRIGADLGPALEARNDHEPADRALQRRRA